MFQLDENQFAPESLNIFKNKLLLYAKKELQIIPLSVATWPINIWEI